MRFWHLIPMIPDMYWVVKLPGHDREVLDNKSKSDYQYHGCTNPISRMDAKDMKYRKTGMPLIIWSSMNPIPFIMVVKKLLRTRDMGLTWTEASPDLTRNEKMKKQGKPEALTNESSRCRKLWCPGIYHGISP